MISTGKMFVISVSNDLLNNEIWLLSQGHDWQRQRSALNRPMMNTQVVASYTEEFQEVAEDMVDRMDNIRLPGGEIPNLGDELFNWSMECKNKHILPQNYLKGQSKLM